MNIYVDEAQHFSSVVMVGWLLPLSCGAVPHVWDVFLFFSHMRTWTGTFITLMHFSHGYKNSTSECYMEAMLYSEKEHTGKYAHVSAQLFIPATLWLLMHYYLVQTISLFHLPSLAPFFFSLYLALSCQLRPDYLFLFGWTFPPKSSIPPLCDTWSYPTALTKNLLCKSHCPSNH